LTWATLCDGNHECIDNSDEEGCKTSIWVLPLILFGIGFLLVVTLFLYSFENIYYAVKNISYNGEISADSFTSRHLQIGILTEENDIKMIEQLFINEVKMQGNEGEAICSFKVFYFHGSFKHRIQRTEVHN
jgi:hypothetical protein